MRLQYEISATGQDQLRRVIRGVESELNAHARRTSAMVRRTTGTTRPQRPHELARGMDQIGKAARAADMAAGRQQMALERRRHTEAMRNRQREAQVMAKGFASIAAVARGEEIRRHRESIRNANQEARARARIAARTAASMTRGVGTVGASVRNVAGMGAGILGIGGGFALTGAVQEQIRVQAKASQLANQAGQPGIKGTLAQEASSVRGASAEDALAGMEEFVTKTGDLDTARKLIGDLNTLALATGSNLGDLGATAGQAFNVLKDQISDPTKRLEELNKLMGVLAQQGAMGAVEIRDLAQDFGKLGAATRGFEGDAPKLLRTMGAFAQLAVARGGAESSADASTAAARLVNDIVVNKKKFKGIGVDIKSTTDPTKLRDPMAILTDVLAKTGGDITKTSGLFGAESRKIFQGLSPVFAEAEKKQKGSGKAAVMAEFQRFATAEIDPKELAKRAESRINDPDIKYAEAIKNFNREVGTRLLPVVANKLLPAFERLTPRVADAAEVAADLIESFTKYPVTGIGIIIGAAIVKDIAAAGVGRLAASALTKMASGFNLGGKAGAAGASPAAGRMAAAGVGLTLGAVAAITIYAQGVDLFNQSEQSMGQQGALVKRGLASDDLSEVATLLEQAKKRRQELGQENAAKQGPLGAVTDFVTGRGEQRAVEMKSQEGFVKQLEARLAALEAAANKMAESADAGRDAAIAMKDAAGASNRNKPIAQR